VKIGAKALLADATDQANLDEVARLASLVMSKIVGDGVVGILGLSYKPETNVIDDSPGLLLAQALAEENISVVAFDPAAMEQSREVLGKTVRLADSMESCIKQADVVVITTPWNDFKSIKPDLFDAPENRILIDCWRVLDQSHFNQLKGYIGLGIGPSKNRSVI
jgi:UDPglucose 6-dehydrogenase